MKEVNTIYQTSFGVCVQWNTINHPKNGKYQVIFNNTGFYLTLKELVELKNNTCKAIRKSVCSNEHCEIKNNLLNTCCKNIDLVVSNRELHCIKNLLEGTLFQIELKDYLNSISVN